MKLKQHHGAVMAEELQVPDFKNVYEFDRWVYKLEDKEIQSWTTKDWLKMYEKMDKMQTLRTNPEKDSLKDALIKLNRNYRLEENDFKKMQEIGKKIGHNLAQQKMDFDLAGVNIDNKYLEGAREQYARAADKAVYESSQYAGAKETPLGNYDKAASEIGINQPQEINHAFGATRYKGDDFSSQIRISNTTSADVFGVTPIHESVHAQLQTARAGQKEALEKLGLKPEEGFSEDFYKLLQYNDKYYVRDTADSGLYDDLSRKLESGDITEKEFKKLEAKEVFKGYAKQPLETHAEIIGSIAEHYYRQETGQLSERAARAFANFKGQPIFAQYNKEGKINLTYDVKDKNTLDTYLNTFLDKETKAKISAVYDEKTNRYTITIPSDYKSKIALEQSNVAVTFSGCYGLNPNTIDYSQPDKIVLHYNQGSAEAVKDIFEHNEFGKFSEETLKNIEIKPLTNGGYTIAIPKNEKEANKVILEMADIHKKVEDWQKALVSANAAYQAGQPVSITCDVIPQNADLSTGPKKIELDVKEIGKGVKLPEEVTLKSIREGMDLSTAQKVTVSGYEPKIGKNIKLPEIVEMNSVPQNADLSSAKKLILNGNSYIDIGEGAKLPKEVTVKQVHGALDLSGAEHVVFDGVAPEIQCKFPPKVEICNTGINNLPNIPVKLTGECSIHGFNMSGSLNLDKCDLSQVSKVDIGNCIITENTKLPKAEKMSFHDAVQVNSRTGLETVLKSDISDVLYIEVASKEMMNGLEYPKNAIVGFANIDEIYAPNEEALNRLKQQYGEIPEDIKVIKAENVVEKVAEKPAVQTVEKTTEKAATKTATKTALKAQATNAVRKVGKTAAKTVKSVGNTALKANAKFDAAVDKAIDKGAEKLNNSKIGKAYQKVTTKVAESKAGKAVAKTTSKAVEKVAASTAGKTVGKVVAKTAASAVGKSVLKKIPLVSAGAGAYFAYERLKNGELKAAGCELLSGIAGCFPGIGTAASVAIDVGLATNDIRNVVKESKNQTAQATLKVPTQPQKKVAPKDLSKQIAQRAEMKKKTTQKTTVSTNQVLQTKQNSRA